MSAGFVTLHEGAACHGPRHNGAAKVLRPAVEADHLPKDVDDEKGGRVSFGFFVERTSRGRNSSFGWDHFISPGILPLLSRIDAFTHVTENRELESIIEQSFSVFIGIR
jgi:hypothetical protein